MKKNVKIFAIALIVSALACIMAFSAMAAVSADMALAVGRGMGGASNGLTTKLEPLSDGTEVADMFCVPVVINESTYVPFRFVFEKMGISVEYDHASKSTVLKKPGGRLPVYDLTGKSLSCMAVEISADTMTIIHGDGRRIPEKIDVYKYLGMTYIPARYLERFGALVKWDPQKSVVYISYEDTDTFDKKLYRIHSMTDAAQRQAAIDDHFAKVMSTAGFSAAVDSYLSSNAECFNNQNGGLVQPYNGKNYYPNLNIEKDGWYTQVGDDARQLCYATDGVDKFIYYFDRDKQKLRRLKLDTEDIVKDKPVTLPAFLEGKIITHITSYDGNLFFVAYDNPAEGGHIYMSKVGSEEKSTVKITKDKAWNYYVSPTYKMYFVNFTEGYRLTSIDMRSMDNINVFVNNPYEGVLSDIVNFTPMQSFAFDSQNATDYYYIDIVSGSLIQSSRNHNTGVEVLRAGKPGVLRNFVNIGSIGGKKSVLYVEYTNGKNGNLNDCKIVQFDLTSKTANVLYESKKAIIGLCVYGGKIYFTDINYSALYELTSSGSSFKASKIG